MLLALLPARAHFNIQKPSENLIVLRAIIRRSYPFTMQTLQDGFLRRQESNHRFRLRLGQPDAVDIGAGGIQPPLAQQFAHTGLADLVELVDCAQNIGLLRGLGDAHGVEHAVQHLAVVHPDQVVAARNPDDLHAIRQHGADLGVGSHARRADCICIALIKLTKPARPRLFIAPDLPHSVSSIGRRQVISVLRENTRQRGRQVITQSQPIALALLFALLPGKDTGVRTIHVGQEFPQGLDSLDRRAFQRVETVAIVDLRDAPQHLRTLGHIGAEIVAETLGRCSLWAGGLGLFRHVETSALTLAAGSSPWPPSRQGLPAAPLRPAAPRRTMHAQKYPQGT